MKALVTRMVLALALGFIAASAFAGNAPRPAQSARAASEQAPTAELNEKWMIEGQKRFLINCGRCHQSPHLFSPRVMSMAVRHMRVRAMLTQEDMDYLLYYMTHQ